MDFFNSMKETVYGFKTKINFFVERIENLRRTLKKEKKDVKILDVGCGNGMQVTLPLGSQGYSLVGIDLHEPSIEQAKQSNNLENVKFILGDVKELIGKLNSDGASHFFDVIILSDILEHLEKPGNLLHDVHLLLKPGGIILISIPNGFGPFEVENFVLRKTGILGLANLLRKKVKRQMTPSYVQTLNSESGHIQFFTRRKFEKLLKSSSFGVSYFKKGCFLGGALTSRLVGLFKLFIKLNLKAGKYLPNQLCSVWYFEAHKLPQISRGHDSGTQNYPRLLMVASSAFNPLSGGGITFTNLFHGWPKNKIATAHSDKIQPSTDVCENYYFLGKDEFKWKFPFVVANLFGLQEKIENSLRSAKGVAAKEKGDGGLLAMLMRLFMPAMEFVFGEEIPTNANISDNLEKWIKEFKPEVLYTILGSLPYMRMVRKISEKFNLPIVIHMMDDWPAVRYKKGIFGFYRRWQMNRELRQLIKKSAACLSICDAMSEAYEKRYGKPFAAFHNALDANSWTQKARTQWRRKSPFRLVYAGALMPDSQLYSLEDVCDAVDELSKGGLDVSLDIYAPWYAASRYCSKLERPECVKVFDAPEKMDGEDLFAKADLLILPVNFDKKTVKYIKYSMPTKVPAYMFSGTPTLAYGPDSVASIKYAHNWAYCVTHKNKGELCDAIKKLASDEELREKLALHAQKLAAERHDRNKVAKEFQEVLMSVTRNNVTCNL